MTQPKLAETIIETILFMIVAPIVVALIAGGVNLVSHGVEERSIAFFVFGSLIIYWLTRHMLYRFLVHLKTDWQYHCSPKKAKN